MLIIWERILSAIRFTPAKAFYLYGITLTVRRQEMKSISIKDGEFKQIGEDVSDIWTGPTRYIRITNE